MAWMEGKRKRKTKKVDCWRVVGFFWTVIFVFFFFILKLTGATDKLIGDDNIFGR